MVKVSRCQDWTEGDVDLGILSGQGGDIDPNSTPIDLQDLMEQILRTLQPTDKDTRR